MLETPRHTARQQLALITRQRIMEATAALLRDGGEDVTFDLVAKRSGVPVRTVYRHYESKEALFTAFWQWMNEAIDMPAAPTTAEELVAHIPRLFAAFERDEALVRAMLHNPHGRAVRISFAQARQAKFEFALRDVLDPLAVAERTRILATVTVLCSASGWESMKDNWQLDGHAAAEAAQWAVAALIRRAGEPGAGRSET